MENLKKEVIRVISEVSQDNFNKINELIGKDGVHVGVIQHYNAKQDAIDEIFTKMQDLFEAND